MVKGGRKGKHHFQKYLTQQTDKLLEELKGIPMFVFNCFSFLKKPVEIQFPPA